MKTSRTLVALATTMLAAASLTACSGDATADADGNTIVKVGTLKGQPHLYAPYFYEENAPEGVTFEIVTFDTSPDIKNAVVSGSIDCGVAGVPSAMSGASAGQDVVVVAASSVPPPPRTARPCGSAT